MKEVLPAIFFFVSLWVAGALGNQISKRTGKRAIGWPAGIVIFFALIGLCGAVFAAQPRSYGAKATFMRLYHCPATDKPRGPCPGYVIDHITALCAGGADDPLNMQWQTVAEAKAKDRIESAECAAMRRR